MAEIVATEDVLNGAPRIAGRRISVLRVVELVQTTSPEYAVDQLDITLGELYTALAYYYEHPEEMESERRRQRKAGEDLREQALQPPEELEQ